MFSKMAIYFRILADLSEYKKWGLYEFGRIPKEGECKVANPSHLKCKNKSYFAINMEFELACMQCSPKIEIVIFFL